jgi:hypothetical protein
MDATKPYEFIGFGAMDVTKPYEFIGFGEIPWQIEATWLPEVPWQIDQWSDASPGGPLRVAARQRAEWTASLSLYLWPLGSRKQGGSHIAPRITRGEILAHNRSHNPAGTPRGWGIPADGHVSLSYRWRLRKSARSFGSLIPSGPGSAGHPEGPRRLPSAPGRLLYAQEGGLEAPGIPNYRLVTHFRFLIVGPDQHMVTERPWNWSPGLIVGAFCTIFRARPV